MYSKLETSSTKSKNLALALIGIDIAHKRFPLGAINRKDTFESIGYPLNVKQLQLFGLFREAVENNDAFAQCSILNSRALLSAQCGDMVAVVLHDLKRFTDTPAEWVSLDKHQMMVIVRDPSLDPSDILRPSNYELEFCHF